jgi:chromosomal replication initiation ATPase DnaA
MGARPKGLPATEVMSTQVPLPLSLPQSYRRADFVIAPCNASALALVTQGALPAGKSLLTGGEGSGKTHLLHLWAQEQGAQVIRGALLAQADIPALAIAGRVAVDDADHVRGGDGAGETALFHLHNLLAECGGQLLMTARAPVRDWGLALPDLHSRLQAAAHVALGAPDDTLLAAVLTKHFADRQIRVPDTLIPFLLARMTRSLATAQRVATLLDTEAMARAKPITRALAAEVLQGQLEL